MAEVAHDAWTELLRAVGVGAGVHEPLCTQVIADARPDDTRFHRPRVPGGLATDYLNDFAWVARIARGGAL